MNAGARTRGRLSGAGSMGRVLLLLPAVALFAGCDLHVGNLSARATDEWTHTYPLKPGGEIEISTTNGQVKGDTLTGAVDARTTNGGVNIDLSSIGKEPVSLRTTNGAVTLTLPDSARADISASVTNGGISVGEFQNLDVGEKSRRHFEGRVNGGGIGRGAGRGRGEISGGGGSF